MTHAGAPPGPLAPETGVPPSASVIVVSRHRPAALALCLAALRLQDHPRWDLILVADPGAVGVRPDLDLTRVAFDAPNISAARNAGLARATGEVVAFIDDDAIAEPGWLGHLTAPFADPRVIAAAGFTRGPDGLAWQVRAERMTPDGIGQPLPIAGADPVLLAPAGGCPVSTLGTNCAFRREALCAVGGFDPVFSYHLDESDVNLRMAARWPDGLTAVVPRAEVVHGLAADLRRGARGVPADLTQIGRSHAVFARRHGGSLAGVVPRQRARLIRHMLAGRLDPLRVRPLIESLARGLAQGQAAGDPGRPAPGAPFLSPEEGADPRGAGTDGPAAPVRSALPSPRLRVHLAGWQWQAASLRAQAAREVAAGAVVSLILLSPTLLPHRSEFRPGGWWEQRGGLWGPSLPKDPPVIRLGFAARVARELERLNPLGR